MSRYVCPICGFVHDDATGERFEDLPASWTCPVCGAAKSQFEREAAQASADERAELLAPKAPGFRMSALLVHRVFGYVFVAVYLILVLQMIPRLWSYQIEFPARTVVHISLGMAVGVMLLLKIGIVRFFRRLDQALVPVLGTSMLVSSVVLIGISVPWAFREAYATAQLFAPESQQRVQKLLAQTELTQSECERYSSAASLRGGRQILRQECIDCHDLRTVLAKPRTPTAWRQTVRRMADRTTLLNPLEVEEQWQVTAYLIALSPQLQKSARQLTEQQGTRAESRNSAGSLQDQPLVSYDAVEAQALFEAKCSQCHLATLVTDANLESKEETRELVVSMVEEGMDASEAELLLIVEYLTRTYVK